MIVLWSTDATETHDCLRWCAGILVYISLVLLLGNTIIYCVLLYNNCCMKRNVSRKLFPFVENIKRMQSRLILLVAVLFTGLVVAGCGPAEPVDMTFDAAHEQFNQQLL